MLLLGISRLFHAQSAKSTSYNIITSSQEICILYITVRPADLRRHGGINRQCTNRLTYTRKHPTGINIQKIEHATAEEPETPATAPNP